MGKTTRSNLHAPDIAEARNIADVGPEPGKQTLPQGFQMGDDYIDKGPACRGRSGADCFLVDDQRERLIATITRLIGTAQTNYKAALLDLKISELLKKEEDLNWVLVLALDLLTAHLSTVVSIALKGLQAKGASRLNELGLRAGVLGESPDKWRERAEGAIALATPSRIDSVIKAGFTFAGTKAKAAGKTGVNAATQKTKASTIAYIDQLRDQCDPAFDHFIRVMSGQMEDADLVATHDGFLPDNQSTGLYIESLGGKLARFRHSGVLDIGRGEVKSDDYGGTKLRDTRVVYVQDINGTKIPWYQREDGIDVDHGYIAPGDPDFESVNPTNPKHKARWSKFGPRGNDGTTQLDRPVPEEFRDVAIAASEARWGAIPIVDDGYVTMLKQQGIDVEAMRQRTRGGTMVSQTFPPDRTPWDTKPVPAGLPPGSIFEEQKP